MTRPSTCPGPSRRVAAGPLWCAEQELRRLPVPARTALSRLLADALVSTSVSIRPRRLAVQELETGPLHRFGDWPNEQVPKRAAGVYTVWEGDRLL
jgi:hypothetical protein